MRFPRQHQTRLRETMETEDKNWISVPSSDPELEHYRQIDDIARLAD